MRPPGGINAYRLEKPTEYARAGIPHFWRVEYDDNLSITVHRYRLDPTGRRYETA